MLKASEVKAGEKIVAYSERGQSECLTTVSCVTKFSMPGLLSDKGPSYECGCSLVSPWLIWPAKSRHKTDPWLETSWHLYKGPCYVHGCGLVGP